MSILLVLKIIAAVGTIVTGIISAVRPLSIKGFTGLDVTGARGVTEIRAVMGGTFIGAGLAPIILGVNAAYQVLGFIYLAIGLIRGVSMILDKSVMKSNVISLAVEIVFGVLLVF
jgi:hypothetical protein